MRAKGKPLESIGAGAAIAIRGWLCTDEHHARATSNDCYKLDILLLCYYCCYYYDYYYSVVLLLAVILAAVLAVVRTIGIGVDRGLEVRRRVCVCVCVMWYY